MSGTSGSRGKERADGRNGTRRQNIKPGIKVKVVQKQDQITEQLTEGVVKDILTKSAFHPWGIKVRLESGINVRVREIEY